MTGQADAASMVDFLVIGAQKSGTTTLYELLNAHPAIFIPGAKELEFFSDPVRYGRGYKWYCSTYFAKAPAGSVKGEASTHYMMYPEAPGRIAETLPDAKLIAILRNPAERAYSHYRMSVMRGRERRPFQEAVESAIEAPVRAVSEDYDYLRFGEYGRILSDYLDRFPRGNLHVAFTEELDSDPSRVIRNMYSFLGVDAAFAPPNLDRRANVGGAKIIPGLDSAFRRSLGWAWRHAGLRRVMSRAQYDRLMFWSFTELNIRAEKGETMDAQVRTRLRDYYAADVARIESLCGVVVPWPEYRRFLDAPRTRRRAAAH